MKIVYVGVLTAGVLVAPLSAGAAPPPAFAGSCRLSGTVTFQPALTALPRTDVQDVSLSGSCSGTIGTTRVTGAPATETATETAPDNNCATGADTGTGVLVVGGLRLPFRVREVRVAATSVISLTGTGWSGTAFAYVDPSQAVAVASSCLAGALPSVRVDVVDLLRATAAV